MLIAKTKMILSKNNIWLPFWQATTFTSPHALTPKKTIQYNKIYIFYTYFFIRNFRNHGSHRLDFALKILYTSISHWHMISNFYERMETSLVHTVRTGNESPRGRMHMAAGLHKQITPTIDIQARLLMYREHVTMQYIKRITVKFMLRHTNYFYDSTKEQKKKQPSVCKPINLL